MTIRQRGSEGICESQFWVDGDFYQFTFNGKKGMPLITTKRKAKVHEEDLKRTIRIGTFLKDSELKDFTKFFNEIYLDYSRKHKTPLATAFDEYYGRRLLEEFGKKTLGQITPRMIENLRPRIEQITQKRLDKVVGSGRMDVIQTLAYPLPVVVIH